MLTTLLPSFTHLVRQGIVWWRWLRRSSFPWWSFGLACWQLLWANQPDLARLRFAIALAKLDHLGLMTLLNDCLW